MSEKKNLEKWRLVKEPGACSSEKKIFYADVSQFTDTMTCGRLRLRYALTHDSTKVTTFSPLSKHAWIVPLKTKSRNEMATAIAKII